MQSLPFYNVTQVIFEDIIQPTSLKFSEFLETHNLLSALQNYTPEIIHKRLNCKYYNENSLYQLYNQIKPKLSLMHFNIRSLNKHRLQFQTFLEVILHYLRIIDCIMIQVERNVEVPAFLLVIMLL